jgi:RNA polymerase sigma factor (sigma-70 family)
MMATRAPGSDGGGRSSSGPADAGQRAEWLAEAELRDGLERYVRRRLRDEDAGDVVQATMADALASDGAPLDHEGFRRFVFTIARNKVADHYRRHSREQADEQIIEHAPGSHDPVSAKDLLRWAEEALPSSEDKSTLEWMLREADGDKLEHIAQEENVPAPRVRQRVSRLRKYLRARWAAQLAAAGVAGLVIVFGVLWYQKQRQIEVIKIERDNFAEEGRRLRRAALGDCQAREWQRCLDGLDRAKQLDPSGDDSQAVRDARRAAAEALAPPPILPRQLEQAPEPVPSASVPAPKSAPAPKLAPAPKPRAPRPASTEDDSNFGKPAEEPIQDFKDPKQTAPLPAKPAPQMKAPTKPQAPTGKKFFDNEKFDAK